VRCCASALFEYHSIKTQGITQKQINITLCFEAPSMAVTLHISAAEQGTNYVDISLYVCVCADGKIARAF